MSVEKLLNPTHQLRTKTTVFMEDYKSFKIVSVYRDGKSIGIDSAYDAAVYLLEHWPDVSGPKLETAKAILLKCLAGECSAQVARVAFVEAAKEAGIYVETMPRPAATGKLERRGKRQ